MISYRALRVPRHQNLPSMIKWPLLITNWFERSPGGSYRMHTRIIQDAGPGVTSPPPLRSRGLGSVSSGKTLGLPRNLVKKLKGLALFLIPLPDSYRRARDGRVYKYRVFQKLLDHSSQVLAGSAFKNKMARSHHCLHSIPEQTWKCCLGALLLSCT